MITSLICCVAPRQSPVKPPIHFLKYLLRYKVARRTGNNTSRNIDVLKRKNAGIIHREEMMKLGMLSFLAIG